MPGQITKTFVGKGGATYEENDDGTVIVRIPTFICDIAAEPDRFVREYKYKTYDIRAHTSDTAITLLDGIIDKNKQRAIHLESLRNCDNEWDSRTIKRQAESFISDLAHLHCAMAWLLVESDTAYSLFDTGKYEQLRSWIKDGLIRFWYKTPEQIRDEKIAAENYRNYEEKKRADEEDRARLEQLRIREERNALMEAEKKAREENRRRIIDDENRRKSEDATRAAEQARRNIEMDEARRKQEAVEQMERECTIRTINRSFMERIIVIDKYDESHWNDAFSIYHEVMFGDSNIIYVEVRDEISSLIGEIKSIRDERSKARHAAHVARDDRKKTASDIYEASGIADIEDTIARFRNISKRDA